MRPGLGSPGPQGYMRWPPLSSFPFTVLTSLLRSGLINIMFKYYYLYYGPGSYRVYIFYSKLSFFYHVPDFQSVLNFYIDSE